MLAGILALVFLSRRPVKVESVKEIKTKDKNDFLMGVRHIGEIVPVEFIRDGMYVSGGKYCCMARIEGTNFSVMSESQQNAQESALIGILNRIDFPVQFITTSVVADTAHMARVVASTAKNMPEGNLKTYAALYASALDAMRTEKQILAQHSYIILTDDGADPVAALKEKMKILYELLRPAGVMLTPLTSEADVMDVFASILMPEVIIRPSEMLEAGSTEELHVNAKELVAGAV
ncbi:hypothetical protein Desku_0824 [Desulfofundulus kuznetsovii DSM 6115]|uniref:Uncharacterized protein n=1 Tax=Desulfofundulus kuznetsovii (strain DSM 6115 / VKM B-1805 / 17) TaxID=760568 RepID=A0AAU8PUD2_DESK7|nr:hypothetical protein Desku_0824 [Desulfofundulus kuznetsovii DSM 6115]